MFLTVSVVVPGDVMLVRGVPEGQERRNMTRGCVTVHRRCNSAIMGGAPGTR